MDADLFEDRTYLHDSDLIDRLFIKKLAADSELLREEQGWQWAEITTSEWGGENRSSDLVPIYRTEVDLPEADEIEYEALIERQHDYTKQLSAEEKQRLEELELRADGDFTDEDRETGGIIVKVNSKGEMVIEGAYAKKTETSSNDDSVEHTPATTSNKPALTLAGTEDLRRIRLMAIQGALLDKPDYLLDLFGWQLERAEPAYSSPFAISMTDQAIAPEAEGSWHMDPRLTDPDRAESNYNEDTAATFAAFQAKGKKHRNQIITRCLVRTLQIPAGRMAAQGKVMAEFAGVNIRKAWTPDAPTYFSRLSVPAMEAIWAEMLDAEADDERIVAFGKLKKAQKAKDLADLFENAAVQEAHGLTRDQIAAIDAWLPPELRGDEA